MTLRDGLRVLASKWYLLTAGALISAVLAGLVYSLVPPSYASSGIAMVIQPKRYERGPTSNPLLNFDASLSTTALILVEQLGTPQTAAMLGVRPGGTSFYQVDHASTDDGGASGMVVQPFVSVKTRARTAGESEALVGQVLGTAADMLTDQQRSLRVLPTNYVRLEILGGPAPAKRVLTTALAAAGAVLLIGMCLSVGAAFALHAWSRRRQRRRAERTAQPAGRRPAARLVEGPLLPTGPVLGPPSNGTPTTNGTPPTTNGTRAGASAGPR